VATLWYPVAAAARVDLLCTEGRHWIAVGLVQLRAVSRILEANRLVVDLSAVVDASFASGLVAHRTWRQFES
jgi:hypothetical protein